MTNKNTRNPDELRMEAQDMTEEMSQCPHCFSKVRPCNCDKTGHNYSDDCTCSICHKTWMEALFGSVDDGEDKDG